MQTIYEQPELGLYREPKYVFFNGSIKCIGYQARSDWQEMQYGWSKFVIHHPFDHLFCNEAEKKLESGPHMDKNCWNDTKQSFLCPISFKCISKHRLRNGIEDCDIIEDEFYKIKFEDEEDSQTCYKKNKHRLNCSGNPSICLPVSIIGDGYNHCNTTDDEFIIELKWVFADRKCITPDSIECNILKTYIQSNSSVLLLDNSKIISFREYCDTVWHLPRGFDESLCKEWKCPKDQYQCLTGHCIPIISEYTDVYSVENVDWDCPDASDDIGLLGITQLSEHNAQLISDSDLEKIKNQTILYRTSDMSSFVFFTTYCNIHREYKCILANVNNSVNFTINRPCINLTQIGDGIIDCYGGLDERNLLTCGNNTHEQRGFDFHCNDQECIPYRQLCEKRCSNNADSVLCDQLPTLWSSSCVYPTKHMDICKYIGPPECHIFESNGYYCDIQRSSK
jgi:hypothetical protein